MVAGTRTCEALAVNGKTHLVPEMNSSEHLHSETTGHRSELVLGQRNIDPFTLKVPYSVPCHLT